MAGPSIRLRIDPSSKQFAVHTPSALLLYWHNVVKEQLDADVTMGVIKK